METAKDADDFIEVNSPKSKKSTTIRTPLDEKKHRFGILLSHVASKPTLQNQGIDIGALFNAILQLDKDAIFLPHDNDTHRAVKLSTMIKPTYDFKAMMDFEITNWGRPSDNKGKLSMSFYIASDILQPDIMSIQQDPLIQRILKQHKMMLYPHNLLQSDSRPVAYFSGKSVAHTWRKDLKEPFGTYLTEQLNDSATMLNLFGEDHDVPMTIPFFFRVMTLRNKWGSAQAIGIHVGTLHKEFLETIIKQSPFPDVELISLSLRRKNPSHFDKCIRLHEYICNNSCAIKLMQTTVDSRDTLRLELSKDSTLTDKIINLAESSKASTDGTLYVQCLQKHRPLVSNWITAFLTTYATEYPLHEQPIFPGRTNSHDHFSVDTTPLSTWSKHQSFLDEDAPHQSFSDTTAQKSIPESIIIGQNMSYAADASRSTHRTSYYSNVSSPTNSKATHKTHREILLETEVTNLRNEFAQFKATQAEGTVSSKSSKSNREVELEAQVHQLTSMVHQQNQTLTQQAAMITDLQTSMQAFMSQFHTGVSSPTTSTPQLGKQKDGPTSSPTRRSSHGINNAGEDTEMSIPPDPHAAHHDVNPSFDSAHMSNNVDTSYYDEESLQETLVPDASVTGTKGSAHVTWSKSDMKKQC